MGLLHQQQVRTVFLEVAAKNKGAGAFYRLQGFRAVGRRKGYYTENNGDALVLRVDLT
jgi:ribosomal protein S18 acetylase RimI-like enzyme